MPDRVVKVTGVYLLARRKFSEDSLQLPSCDGNVLVQGIESHFLRCVLRLGGPTPPYVPQTKAVQRARWRKGAVVAILGTDLVDAV